MRGALRYCLIGAIGSSSSNTEQQHTEQHRHLPLRCLPHASLCPSTTAPNTTTTSSSWLYCRSCLYPTARSLCLCGVDPRPLHWIDRLRRGLHASSTARPHTRAWRERETSHPSLSITPQHTALGERVRAVLSHPTSRSLPPSLSLSRNQSRRI